MAVDEGVAAHDGALSEVSSRLRAMSPAERRAVMTKLGERRAAVERVAPASYAQQRLWFLEELAPGNPYYNETSAFRFLFALDVTALQRSLNAVVQRHEALRTVFAPRDGEPQQRVLRRLDLELPVVDLGNSSEEEREREAVRIAELQGREPFDLAKGPLLRATLVRLADRDWVFVLTMHHIVCDGWSMRLFFDELQALYAEVTGGCAELPELPVQYADFAAWQRSSLTGPALNRQLDYWREQLADVPTLDLPLDFRRPAVPTFGGGREAIRIPAETYGAVRQLCDETRATPFMALLAAYQVLLHRYTGQDDIAVGSPIANRARPEDELLIGFFVNTVVLRGDLSGEPTFRETLRRVRDVALAAYEHQDVPFELVVEALRPEREGSRNPIFQVTFQMLRAPVPPAPESTRLMKTLDVDVHTSKFDLRCDVWEDGAGGVEGYLEYSSDLFRPERVRAMARHFETLVIGAAATPDAGIGELPLLTEADEQRLLVEWNGTSASFAGVGCVHHELEAWAERDASAPAVTDARTTISYGGLNSEANRLARYLRTRGVVPGSLVAVLSERSVEYVVAIVAITKAGAAYVPLDPAYPQERLALIMRDAEVPLVLTTDREAHGVPPGVECIRLDVDRGRWAGRDPSNLPSQVDARSLAYVVFTSGSTGRPKGVELLHDGLTNLVCWHNVEYNVAPHDRATLYASPAFDASVWEMWPYLAAGASLWIPDERVHRSPDELLAWMAENGITISFLPTPVAEEVIERELPALRLRALLTGGDRLRSYPRRALPFRFVNHYGPTEATVVATFADAGSGPTDEAPPIGRPISNTQAFVLDRSLRPVPAGVKGELYLTGRGLARGYLNDAALTRERFVPNPFDRRLGSRMYRTGDVVRHRPDGLLEFHGRVDRQIKVRGFRIEPEDIESLLDEHPSVRKSLVLAAESPSGYTTVAAYLLPPAEGSPTPVVTAEDDRTREWQRIYDAVYGAEKAGIDPSFDLVGWNSSYTGLPLSEAEMHEQVDGTVERVQALGGRRILEIGCGTGLLLFRLAHGCDRYVATDFSASALDAVRDECERRGLGHVELVQCPADDLGAIGERDFDVVVLNSVVQYFPGVEYLMRVLAGAVAAVRPGGSVFVGDVRNLRLLSWLHAAVEVLTAADETDMRELRERIARRVEGERELVIDPAFFSAWAATEADVRDVQVEVRRGRHHNEITKFRYDVVLGVGTSRDPVGAWEERRWEELDGVAALSDYLRERRPQALALRDVPSARTSGERRLLRLLDGSGAEFTAAALRRDLRTAAGDVEPEDLWELEREGAYTVRIGWSASGLAGHYDAWFVARRSADERRWQARVPLEEPTQAMPWSSYVNDVLGRSQQELKTRELREYLRGRVPEYMVPSDFVWTDRLPLTPNGKFDRRALPPARDHRDQSGSYVSPQGDLEERIALVWSEVLGLERVGAETNFFDLGGHSLLLVKVHNRLSEDAPTELSIIDLFNYPTVRSLAEAMTKGGS